MSGLPFAGHRTMAEVAETERLKKIKASSVVTGGRARRLDQLLDMEEFNNPPPPTEPDDAA